MLKTVSASERTSKLSEAGGVLVSPGSVASDEVIWDSQGGECVSPGDGAHVEVAVSPANTTTVSIKVNAAAAVIVFRLFMVSPRLVVLAN
jgi:hypothetical protein